MKKVFSIGNFENGTQVADNSLIVAYKRSLELYLQNIEYPKDRVSITLDRASQEIVIRLKVYDGEYLAIGDAPGMAEKTRVDYAKS